MLCPYCQTNDTKVIDSRESEAITRRRRECLKCQKRFTTYERVEYDLIVIKKDGRREPYNREKLKMGLSKACEKRPVSGEVIDKAVDKIECELRVKDTNEISSKVIGELVMKKLKSIDKIAYIRFASVYREFNDISDFKKQIKEVS